ncbi:DUF3825 domain-containing protein [Aureimonas populi]|uniref:DUF3825 domain-containing protein n=1 Tax=Aureimonas populi TaxID=1701758 RepID=A0ABW5CHU3_9HYPH|nr:DUF3825 domain-containing protein [Aureimonas populi]
MATRIFDFARVADWDDRLATLASMAEPERWKNLHLLAKNQHPVLDRYLTHTFIRAYDQQKIVIADQVACFNTGLLTPGQEEIFGVFTVSDTYDRAQPISPANKKWWLKSWARSGDRVLTDFMELPNLTEYWNDPKDLIFDPKLQVQLNLDHIIRDNLNRFPEELGGKVGKDGKPTDLAEDAAGDDDDDNNVEDNGQQRQIPVAARNALEGAVKQSIRLAQRSYRLAVPQFYRGKIQLLLPLYLRDSSQPDLALTLERHGGWYRAATILYTDWAYSHARLLARPNSEWLGGFRTGVRDVD